MVFVPIFGRQSSTRPEQTTNHLSPPYTPHLHPAHTLIQAGRHRLPNSNYRSLYNNCAAIAEATATVPEVRGQRCSKVILSLYLWCTQGQNDPSIKAVVFISPTSRCQCSGGGSDREASSSSSSVFETSADFRAASLRQLRCVQHRTRDTEINRGSGTG